MAKSDKSVVIIGAGIGGLATAVRTALKGYKVSVYEKADSCGGKLTEFELGDYRFDFGPSLFTMPQYVLEIFKEAGKDPKDYFTYKSLPEACRYFYPDGTRFTAPTNEEEFVKIAASTFDVSEKKLKAYMDENRKIFENAGEVFLTHSLQKVKTWIQPKVVKSLFHSYVLNMLKSMHQVTSKRISDPRLVQLFDRYATYNGSSPYKASSILNSISSLEHEYGTYFPVGGMAHIAKSIENLAKELGVIFHYNQTVDRIKYAGNTAQGIEVDGKAISADIVVSNMDVHFTYERLLQKSTARLEKREKSSSAVIFYWGIDRSFDELGLHNVMFSDNYEKEFTEIFDEKTLPTDPTIYINISSKHSPSDAPANAENWFVMINVPADFGQKWGQEIVQLKRKVVSTISEQLKVDISKHIAEEWIADPRTIADRTISHRGALYGTSSNHWLSAFLRHPNFSSEFKNLYFVGGTVHPGGGIPLCLLSAKIASDLMN